MGGKIPYVGEEPELLQIIESGQVKAGSRLNRVRRKPPSRQSKNFRGRYDLLELIAYYGSDGKKAYWMAKCHGCGSYVIVNAAEVVKAHRKRGRISCGCKQGEWLSERRRTHGMSKHPAFAVWRSMIDRCRLPTHHAWKNYGGRGIMVCERWQESFQNFWEDMGPTYRPGLTLDRIDNDGPYSPENCRWVSYKQQSRNKRTNRYIDTPWGRMTVAEAAERSGIGVTTLLYRLAHGWPQDKLFIEPDFRRRIKSKSST